ncbi:MAG TPA: hypothetical protein VFV15_05300 [Moraxellaceae bacterium]|nr:hypothetical protein [Moraxellaceae bacterium]
MDYRQPVWWGPQDFTTGQARAWDMAGLLLEVTRQPHEWQFRLERTPAQSEDNHAWQRRDGAPLAAAPGARLIRHVFRQTAARLRLLPRLADRSVVVRPVSPLFVPAGQETTFFVSTPLWVAAWAEGVDEPLLDVPVVIPRDTWFGPGPVRGQLCYATRVNGVTNLDQLQPRPFRAVTPVHVRNSGATALPIERINIPAPHLPLFGAESGRLWTPALTITRPAHSASLQVQIESGISTRAGHVEPLTPARRGSDEHALIRVFDNFFD